MKKKVKKAAVFSLLFLILILLSGSIVFARNFVRDRRTFHTIKWGGLKREYYLYIPSNLPKNKPVPLVFVLHGGGGNGKNIIRALHGKFMKLADRDKFIVVYPSGVDKRWNDGRGLRRYYSQRKNVDDVGFISNLIDILSKKHNIDKRRVYVTGMSNGGLMSYRLALELTGKIAAIAPVTASMGKRISKGKTPSAPISVLIMNGTKDPLMPYNGGKIGFKWQNLGKVLSTDETVKFWVRQNRCSKTPKTTRFPDKNPNDDSRVIRQVYGSGKDGTEVVLYKIEDGGHTWPGGLQYLSKKMIGPTNRDIDACAVIWNFFKRHKR